MINPFEELARVADRTFNVVWLPTKDAIQILDDLYEFYQVMKDNGYDYEGNEREGKTMQECNKRISDLGHLLIGKKEFEEYLKTKYIHMVEYDRGYFTAQNNEWNKNHRNLDVVTKQEVKGYNAQDDYKGELNLAAFESDYRDNN